MQFVVILPMAVAAVPRIIAAQTGWALAGVLLVETTLGILASFALGLVLHLAEEKRCLELRPRSARRAAS